MCFFAGGTRFSEQGFGVSEYISAFPLHSWMSDYVSLPSIFLATGSTQLNSSLLTVSVIAVLLPAAFHFAAGADIPDTIESGDILAVSHGVSRLALHARPTPQLIACTRLVGYHPSL